MKNPLISGATGLQQEEPLIFQRSHPINTQPASADVASGALKAFLRPDDANIPELSELEVVRHFVRLSQWNHSIETGFYPLGSCTMKYNPRVNEQIARFPGFAHIHPDQPDDSVQGMLGLLHDLEYWLGEISGLPYVTLQPAAGAHGELTGLMLIRAHLETIGQAHRKKVLVPDSAHGTNPASAALCGMFTVELKSNDQGRINLEELKRHLDDDVAALMLTNPNTAGMFESNIEEICRLVHNAGAYVYGDGANLNALVGVARPGDMGIDCIHINVHKTFSTPHGGGGPGGGPVAVNETLAPYLPVPRVIKTGDKYQLCSDYPQSVGQVLGNVGQSGVMVRAMTYLIAFGQDHIHRIAEDAVLNANYVLAHLKDRFHVPFDGYCKHECLLTDANQVNKGIKTLDIAKRLIDLGFHPMTVYFPLIVHGAMLIEPTETEAKKTLDAFIEAMLGIADDIDQGKLEAFANAPSKPIRTRLDETAAARNPVLVWQDG